jgi:EAL domain-containing protein (putative c-di-GMP-specific phosphodiesterase class I)
MAHGLGLTVVAEGVETAAQRDFLVDVGCDLLQGFFFSRPVPPDVFSGLLAQAPEHWCSTVSAV